MNSPMLQKERSFYKKVIEAILFCAGRPVKVKELLPLFERELSQKEIESVLEELQREYEYRGENFTCCRSGFEWNQIQRSVNI